MDIDRTAYATAITAAARALYDKSVREEPDGDWVPWSESQPDWEDDVRTVIKPFYLAHLSNLDDKALYAEFVNRESEDDKERADMVAAEMEKRGVDF